MQEREPVKAVQEEMGQRLGELCLGQLMVHGSAIGDCIFWFLSYDLSLKHVIDTASYGIVADEMTKTQIYIIGMHSIMYIL